MKRNVWKGLLFLASVALVLSVGGCKEKNEPGKMTQDGKAPSLTFRLTLPQGEAYTYRALHDEPEWAVKKLTLYMFNGEGSKLEEIEQIDMTRLVSNGEAAFSYTKEFAKGKVGVYRFIFMANDEVPGATVGMTQDAFEKLPMTQVLANDGTSKDLLTQQDNTDVIPMTGMARQGSSAQISVTGTTAPVQVTLTRVVARIDVSNHVPNLTITKLYIRNTYDRTTTFPTKDANGAATYMAPTDAQKVTMSAGYAALPDPFTGMTGKEGNLLKKALYLYEGEQPATEAEKDKATTVVVEGKLASGQKVVLDVPFTASSTSYVPVTVRRNYLYKIVLGDNMPIEEGSRVTFTIEDTPWNSVILNHDMQIIEVKCWEMERSTNHYDELTRTFYTRYMDDDRFQLSTRLANHTAFTVKMIKSDSGKEYKMEKKEVEGTEYYILTLPQDLTVEKDEAVFEIYSDADPSIKRYFTVIYDVNYKNPAFN